MKVQDCRIYNSNDLESRAEDLSAIRNKRWKCFFSVFFSFDCFFFGLK